MSTSSGTNCFASLPPTYKGLGFLNDNLFQRRTGDIWVGSAKHNSNLLVPAWSSSASSTSSGTNCFASLPPTYKGLGFLNDNLFQRQTGDIWVGSAKHNSNLLVPVWSSSVTSGTEWLRSPATNCWVRKSACLYNNCQYSGVGSDWGRGDLHNVIRKGPTLFSLLPQSRPSHYPRSEDYERIAFLLPT